MTENHSIFSLIQNKQRHIYGEISDESPMTSAMTRCGDLVISTPDYDQSWAVCMVSAFGLSERLIQNVKWANVMASTRMRRRGTISGDLWHLYLQCTTMGAASGGCIERTRRMNVSSVVAYSGTPWSGHAMNCNWRTSLRSEQPSYTTHDILTLYTAIE